MMLRLLKAVDPRAKLAFLAVFMVATLHARSVLSLGLCLAVGALLAMMVRLPLRTLRAATLPLVPILVFTVVLQVATMQHGPAIAQVGGIAITQAAFSESARIIVCLLALVLASVSFMQVTGVEELVALLRWLLAPLRAAGMRTEGFTLSLTVALGFLPVLVGEFRRLKAAQMARLASFDGTMGERLQAYRRLFAPLLHSSFLHGDGLADAALARGFSCAAHPTRLHAGRFGGAEAACLVLAAALACVVAAF